jgi:hypothetical protein
MAEDHAVTFTTSDAETVLDAVADEQRDALLAAEGDTVALRAVAARWPTLLLAWALLAESSDDPVDSYAFARVGYHRGLDALRQAGWRGSGLVRSSRQENLGFLRSLNALRRAAAAIGEESEAQRCELFLFQLDPHWESNLQA